MSCSKISQQMFSNHVADHLLAHPLLLLLLELVLHRDAPVVALLGPLGLHLLLVLAHGRHLVHGDVRGLLVLLEKEEKKSD